MKLSDWSRQELVARLAGPGLNLWTGPFLNRIRTRIPAVVDGISLLYADYPIEAEGDFADFHVALTQPLGPRRWLRRQVNFEFDGLRIFKPLPLDQALPMMEWGLNWCIGGHAHQYLIIHSATIEKDGFAAILPGAPGSGKSTLTAYLVNNGWRLLSDELALLSLEDGRVTALARPISLKNQSIDIIGGLIPSARLSRRSEDTVKGTVALLKAPADSLARIGETAQPAWVIFPSYKKDAATALVPRPKADTVIEIGRNAFNYSIHGRQGFDLLSKVVDGCASYDFTYSDLAEAREVFAALEPAAAPAREVGPKTSSG
ncbi:HprK-related kinase A [Pelagibius sp.]|uniref:HprK-related kinase A n=1 Tax=Pelagibius sp. TaxID=1931238 RepID=UPI00260D7EA5|nr:HprK-related kinase A [Pelagibius sp.]